MITRTKDLPKVLPPIHPNVGVEAEFRKKLRAKIDQMHKSVMFWIAQAYKANAPEIAQDELPAATLRRVIRELARRWQSEFNDMAPKLAEYYAQSANLRTAKALERILRDGGILIDLKLTREVRDILRAAITENVGLIKSIPQQYFTQIEGHVMRSVQKGGDLATLTKTLQQQYGVTRRRAAFIARDQNNKATAVITRARQLELGIEQAIWSHSGGGKEPRPTHVANSGKKYDVKKGWYDPHEKKYIHPGELINCRCVSRSVVPGL